jgi:hypothetical protein
MPLRLDYNSGRKNADGLVRYSVYSSPERIPPPAPERIRRVLDSMGLGWRADELVSGSTMVDVWIPKGGIKPSIKREFLRKLAE